MWFRYREFVGCGMNMAKTTNFTTVSTGESYPVRSYIICNSTHVVYLMICLKWLVHRCILILYPTSQNVQTFLDKHVGSVNFLKV